MTFCCFNDILLFYYRMRSKSYMNQGMSKLIDLQESIVKGLKVIKSWKCQILNKILPIVDPTKVGNSLDKSRNTILGLEIAQRWT